MMAAVRRRAILAWPWLSSWLSKMPCCLAAHFSMVGGSAGGRDQASGAERPKSVSAVPNHLQASKRSASRPGTTFAPPQPPPTGTRRRPAHYKAPQRARAADAGTEELKTPRSAPPFLDQPVALFRPRRYLDCCAGVEVLAGLHRQRSRLRRARPRSSAIEGAHPGGRMDSLGRPPGDLFSRPRRGLHRRAAVDPRAVSGTGRGPRAPGRGHRFSRARGVLAERTVPATAPCR